MTTEDVFRLNLSLEQLSAVTVAVWVWELPAVREKISNYLSHYKDQNKSDWSNIVTYTLQQISLLHFPKILLCRVENIVNILADKLYDWIRYAVCNLNCGVKYVENIYWTSNGEIDELKIVKYWLENNAEFDPVQHRCFLKKPLLCIAFAYVQEEFIHSHLEEIKKEIFQYLLVSHRKMNWSDYAIIATWISFCHHKTKSSGVKYFRSSNTLPELPADELFLMSVKSGLKFATKYFFTKLQCDNDEKQKLLTRAASKCVALCKGNEAIFFAYEEKCYLEILIFLVGNMVDCRKLQFITENYVFLFKRLLYMWPYHEVCLNLLLNDQIYVPEIHDTLLEKMITDFYSTCHKVTYFGKDRIYSQIFQTLLEKIPEKKKQEIFTKENFKHLNSLEIFNYDILNSIVNDRDLKDYRNDMLAILEIQLQKSILKSSYENVNTLINLISCEDKELVKQKYNFLSTFLTSGNVKLAEEHLHWLCDNNQSIIITMKNQIDCVKICTSLIKKNRFDLASEYLNWQCDNEEDQKKIKESMILNGVLHDQVYQIWCMHTEPGPNLKIADVKRKCEELLYWFLGSDEAVLEYREKKLVEDEFYFIEKYWNSLFYHYSFDCLGDFLDFCAWSPEKIENFRQKIANNFEWWIDTYAVEKNHFLMVHSLFKWVFKNKEERKRIISQYMESSKGAMLILKSFKYNNSRTGILQLFNTWVRPYDPVYMAKIKMNLDVCNNGIVRESVITVIKHLLHQVQTGNYISASDVKRKKINIQG